MEKAEKLQQIIGDEKVLLALSQADSKEAMQKIFRDNGLEMSVEEVDAFITGMNLACSTELDEADLDTVAGGVAPLTVLQWGWTGIKTVAKTCWKAGRWFANNVG